MAPFEDDWPETEEQAEEPEPRPRDPKIDEAKAALRRLFKDRPGELFYGRQLEVHLEQAFFHWITSKALRELVAEGALRVEQRPLIGQTRIRFYTSPRNRYWKRQLNEIRNLVIAYSQPSFTRALGTHGEMMFDAALPTAGFLPKAKDVRAYGGKSWMPTGHDLDRVFERDGTAYGTEIKNSLDYIPIQELRVKLQMCGHLGLRPLFIVRMAPKNYIEMIRKAGGFTLIIRYQLYPHGYETFARQVRDRLRLPVDCPSAIAEGTINRLLNWHQRQLSAKQPH